MLARISVKPWDSLKSAITHTQTSKGGGVGQKVAVHIDGQDVGALETTLDPQRGQLLLVLGPTAAAARCPA